MSRKRFSFDVIIGVVLGKKGKERQGEAKRGQCPQNIKKNGPQIHLTSMQNKYRG